MLADLPSVWRALRPAVHELAGDDRFTELWIEVDHDRIDRTPSLFVRLGDADDRGARQRACIAFLERLGVPPAGDQLATLARCLNTGAAGVRPSHIGLMLSRPGTPVCLIMNGVRLPDLDAYLRDLLGRNAPAPVLPAYAGVFSHVDRVRVALTFTSAIEPRVGLECFVGPPRAAEPRWRGLFDALVRHGACTPEIRDLVMSWPAVLTPWSAKGDWPAPLIAQSLAREPWECSALECRISHVKLVLERDAPMRAKGYVGFVETWADARAPGRGVVSAATPPAAAPAPHSVDDAIEAAVAFLVDARTPTGWWVDYDGFAEGASDEWVTAYVAHALSEAPASNARNAAQEAWNVLCARDRAGWGWNFTQPCDADSTAWALRLAYRLGQDAGLRARAGLDFLRRHVRADGGVSTYTPDAHRKLGLTTPINEGWSDAHTCVTAVAAGCAGVGSGPANFLLSTQLPDGSWPAYWWSSAAYTTAHAVETLAASTRDADAVERATRWATRQLDEADAMPAFDLALTLRAAVACAPGARGVADALDRASRQLRSRQLADGSWPGTAALSIPNSAGRIVPALDARRTFTTATVLRALLALRGCVRESDDDAMSARSR